MDSMLDSLTWADEPQPGRPTRRAGQVWLKRVLVLLAAVAALGVLLIP